MQITIGSRGSDLALWQANYVKFELEKLGHIIEIKIIQTQGDKIQHLSFDKLEGKGFFTKEIELALLNNEIDLAVHSHKDLETTPPLGLIIGAVSYRESPEDVVLINPNFFDETAPLFLKANAKIGTSSARRQSLIRYLRNDLSILELRGNVPTRIQKLRDGKYDAIILAAAGIERLKLESKDLIVKKLPVDQFVPAPAQGVLALQIRENDITLKGALAALNVTEVQETIHIEREILRRLSGGCQLPLGAYCHKHDTNFVLNLSYAENKSLPAQTFNFEGKDPALLINAALEKIKSA